MGKFMHIDPSIIWGSTIGASSAIVDSGIISWKTSSSDGDGDRMTTFFLAGGGGRGLGGGSGFSTLGYLGFLARFSRKSST